MTITAPQNEIPPPAGATHVDPWEYDGPEDEIERDSSIAPAGYTP